MSSVNSVKELLLHELRNNYVIVSLMTNDKVLISNAARLWRSENPLHDENGTVSPDFGIYTGQVNVLDSGDSHLIECWPDSNVLRLFGTESLQYIEKAVGKCFNFQAFFTSKLIFQTKKYYFGQKTALLIGK